MHQILHLLAVLVVVSSRECPLPCICRNLGRQSGRIQADCSNQLLYSLPIFNSSSNVDEVDASGNNFVKLRFSSFIGMENVAILNLSSSLIHEFSVYAFGSLKMLMFLDLSYNRLKFIPLLSFFRNLNLETIILRGNSLGPSAMMFDGESIQNLDFSECGFGPELELSFPRLRTLKLDSNRIHFMRPNSFHGTPHIRHLSLQDNNMMSLPVGALMFLPNLTYLNVDHNPLAAGDLPQLSLKSLETLSARNCSLKQVSTAALEGCPRLRYLHLQQNNITTLSLPEQLDLMALNLSGNPLLCGCSLKPLFQWLMAKEVRVEAMCADSWGEDFTDAMMDLRCDTLPTESPLDEEDVGAGSGVYVVVGVLLVLLCVATVVLVVYWNRVKTMLFSEGRRGFDSILLNQGDESLHS